MDSFSLSKAVVTSVLPAEPGCTQVWQSFLGRLLGNFMMAIFFQLGRVLEHFLDAPPTKKNLKIDCCLSYLSCFFPNEIRHVCFLSCWFPRSFLPQLLGPATSHRDLPGGDTVGRGRVGDTREISRRTAEVLHPRWK